MSDPIEGNTPARQYTSAKKAIDKVREQQQGADDPRVIEMTRAALIQLLFDVNMSHYRHRLEQIGPCVYCADCNVRLYQGTLSKEGN